MRSVVVVRRVGGSEEAEAEARGGVAPPEGIRRRLFAVADQLEDVRVVLEPGVPRRRDALVGVRPEARQRPLADERGRLARRGGVPDRQGRGRDAPALRVVRGDLQEVKNEEQGGSG